ncbi:TPA: Rop family plasmid primer RNA-binding protein [Klebsiella pneumoniae]|nr:Rop family plasmid primer RNA-binding protein [Klebsiella pneumoniae]
MTKQQKTALNMAKFIQNQSLLLLEKLNGEPAEFGKNRTLRFSGHP